MKNRFTILTALLICVMALPAFAATKTTVKTTYQTSGTSQSKTVQLKKLANEYVSIQLKEKQGSTQNTLKEMALMGASDFKLVNYAPCPYRGTIKIGGKSVNAKNRSCTEMKYTYKGKEYSAGKCGKPIR